jgi:arylsulfatase A-like enzyme
VQRDGQPFSLKELLWRDVKRAFAASTVACAAFVIVEFVATLAAAPPDVPFAVKLRLGALTLSLAVVLLGLTGSVLALGAMAARLFVRLLWPSRARVWRGWFSPAQPAGRSPSRSAPWIWALATGVLAYVPLSTLATMRVAAAFREPVLIALVLSLAQLALIAVVAGFVYLCMLGFRKLANLLAGRLGRFNPFGRTALALSVLVVIALIALKVLGVVMPAIKPLIPWRHILALVVFAGGTFAATHLFSRRGGLLPAAATPRLISFGVILFVGALLLPVTLVRLGAEAHTKLLATTQSPPLASIMGVLRFMTDFDRDGYGSLLGENDCAPFNPKIHRGARDYPDNGIDENCDGRDFSLARQPSYRKGERMPVPDEFRRDWNFILITVDTVRYDHTSFGGYIEKKGRDTTPNLKKLVDRSVSFSFTQAPSAGTMASVPAILTSKFFHSGIALDESFKVPKLREQNVLISEILKDEGYYTGAILTHYYFNNWGMEQGFDTYDNSLGAKRAPRAVTDDRLTDKALEWIGRNASRPKWFLWLHYLDPHGRYVEHPGEVSYGTTEEDIYDGELHFSDKQIGRLLDELRRMPGSERTVVVITSDHGDGFGEHGEINHGMHLYREVLHVPMIFYVPNLAPRVVGGATSPLDILPTVADLAGADTGKLSFEGESLVPQLFYGAEEEDRVVFAETNYPKPIRAAVTQSHKLVHHLQANTYELYDLKRDDWEKKNIWKPGHPDGIKMKAFLDDWLERVYYSRDFEANQVTFKLKGLLLEEAPSPETSVQGVAIGDGAIEVIGFDVKEIPPKGATAEPGFAAGDKLEIGVFFAVKSRPKASYRLQLTAHAGDKKIAGTGNIKPGKSIFPTTRWKSGDYVRETFTLTLPSTLPESTVTLALVPTAQKGALGAQTGTRLGRGVAMGSIEVLASTEEEAPKAPSRPKRPGPKPKRPKKQK